MRRPVGQRRREEMGAEEAGGERGGEVRRGGVQAPDRQDEALGRTGEAPSILFVFDAA